MGSEEVEGQASLSLHVASGPLILLLLLHVMFLEVQLYFLCGGARGAQVEAADF